jgi:enoyl-CoA hydratase/carnithine racemase
MSAVVAVSTPSPGVRLVTMQRPESLNALDGQLIWELNGTLDELRDDTECSVVVLTGSGTRGARVRRQSKLRNYSARQRIGRHPS